MVRGTARSLYGHCKPNHVVLDVCELETTSIGTITASVVFECVYESSEYYKSLSVDLRQDP